MQPSTFLHMLVLITRRMSSCLQSRRILIPLALYCMAYSSAGWCAKPASASPQELATTAGYVFAVLPRSLPNIESVVTLRREGDKKDWVLSPRLDATQDAVGAWLPEGTYRLAKWGEYPFADYDVITVKAGHITDLGALVPFSIGAYQFVVLPLRPVELNQRIDSATNEFKSVLKSTEPLSWSPSSVPKPFTSGSASTGLGIIGDLLMAYDRKVNRPPLHERLSALQSIPDFLALAKTTMPPLSDQSAQHADQSLYFGAGFGQIRVRSPEGHWSSSDTGTIDAITAVAVEGDRLIAGSAHGKLLASSDRGAHWAQVAALSYDDSIASITRVGSRWLIATIHAMTLRGWSTADHLTVYVSDSPDLSQPRRIWDTKIDPQAAIWMWPGPAGKESKGHYYLSAVPALYRVDPQSLEFTKLTLPSGVHAFNISHENNLFAAYKIQGAFSKLYLSSDQGNTWTQRDAPPYVIEDIYFDDEATGRAVRNHMKAFTSTRELLDFDAAKNQWHVVREAPPGCVKILHDARHRPAFCLTSGGSILNGSGPGWTVEFAVE